MALRLCGRSPEISVDLSEWAKASQAASVIGWVGADGTVVRELSPELRQAAPLASEDSYEIYRRPVVRVAGARVMGAEGFVVLPDGKYAMQTVWYPSQLILHPQYYERKSAQIERREGNFHSLFQYWARSYYHWLTETLPLLHGLERFLPSDTSHIIPGPPSSFHIETLALLGIESENCTPIHVNEAIEVETLILAPPATTRFSDQSRFLSNRQRYGLRSELPFTGPFNHDPIGLQWVAQKMTSAACRQTQATHAPRRRIYISRKSAVTRRMNDDEIAPVLNHYGFVSCLLEEMSIAEQVMLFSQADIVLAPHGAGLSNLIFCRPGTKVLEVFEPTSIRLCYWSISRIFSLNYTFLIGNTVPTQGWDPDISIDPLLLDKGIRTALDDA